jgi:hypothetical protein
MKPLNFGTRILFGLVSGLAALALAVASVFTAPAATAHADDPTPTPHPAQQARDDLLKNWYQREQNWLNIQTQNLAKANEAAGKVQDWINGLKSKGKDTSALEAALATFQSQIAAAQSSHDTAANILKTHAGFDDSGNVTDPDQARQTLVTARQSLADAHNVLLQAGRDLRKAVQDFRKTNLEENGLPRLQKWLSVQQTHLDATNQIVSKVQDYINAQKAKGKDTSSLEAALATFQSRVATAQASHTTAANILNTHAGFDDSGHVTDPDQARQTLVTARQSLNDAHIMLRQAEMDLHKAVREYRDQNK